MGINLKKRESSKTEDLKKVFTLDENWIPANYHWKWDEAKEFIDFVVDESQWLLNKFRVVQMTWPTKEIAKILDEWDFLRPSWSYNRTWQTWWEDWYELGNDKINLVSKNAEWKYKMFDNELEDNIEGSSLEEHVRRIIAKKVANEIVKAVIYGRALENPSWKNWILNLFNGIKYTIKTKWWQVLDASDSNVFPSREITRKHLVKAKKTLKTKYRWEVEILMDSDIKTDLDELYNDPNGNRWDGEVSKNSVSWMKINEIPLMSSENPVIDETVHTTTTWVNSAWQKDINVSSNLTASISIWDTIVVRHSEADEISYTVNAITSSKITTVENLIYDLPAWSTVHKANLDGADVIITNLKNVVVGIQRDVKVEFERRAPDWYNVWLTLRQDIVIENPEACALIENLKTKDI